MNLKLASLSALVSASVGLSGLGHAATPTTEEMWETIKQQQAEIERLKTQQSQTDMKVEATADAVDSSKPQSGWFSNTTIGGYGEHHYNNFDEGEDQIDAHRFVLFINHKFTDNIKLHSELELEHSLAGDGKPGEVELEQAYIEWGYADHHSVNIGLFLMPVGILNETHEPDTFYGVERNSVEKDIIPTTWWETGVMFSGAIAPGISYDVAFNSGLNTSADSSIRSGRQKSAEATAESFAYTARLKYTAIAGLELATSVQLQQDLSQGSAADEASATLIEAHAVYNRGPFSLRALYAQWTIDGDDYEAVGKDDQSGFYIEPGYKITEKFGVFTRYSSRNTEAGLETSEDKEAVDVGFNYWPHERVVLKADYQSGQSDNVDDSLNLGVGWSF